MSGETYKPRFTVEKPADYDVDNRLCICDGNILVADVFMSPHGEAAMKVNAEVMRYILESLYSEVDRRMLSVPLANKGDVE